MTTLWMPPPEQATQYAPPTWSPPPPRKRLVWPWVLGGIGLTIMLLLGAVVGAGIWWASNLPTVADAEVVYSEDFSDGAGRFYEGSDTYGSAAARDGAYAVTVTSPEAIEQSTVGFSAADVVDVRATMRLDGGADPMTAAGVVVTRSQNEGYVLEISRSGDVVLYRAQDELRPLAEGSVAGVTGPVELRLTTQWSIGDNEVVGYVDGRQVLRYEDAEAWDQFDAAGVYAYAGRTVPITVLADDVIVRAAG